MRKSRLLTLAQVGVALFLTVGSQSNAAALDANKADIHLDSDLKHMDIVIGSPGNTGGCPAGQYWDIGRGRCTTEVQLRTVNVSEACSCTCPAGTLGSCSAKRDGSYPVYGWRLPTAGNEKISRYGATSWGACQIVTNACEEDNTAPPDGNLPPPGTRLYVTAFICNSTNPSYNLGVLSSAGKNYIISVYRSFNYGGRCPESGGYTSWQGIWDSLARDYQNKFSGSYENALDKVKRDVESQMRANAYSNQENVPSVNGPRLNAACTQVAQARYGASVSATYVINTGDTCVIN